MTRHNLGDHLAWLLNRGPLLYPSLDLLGNTRNGASDSGPRTWRPSVASTEVSIVGISNPNPVIAVDSSNAGPTEPPNRDQPDIAERDGSAVTSDNNMARLHFAPPSTSKPRMLSRVNGSSLQTPNTPTASVQRGSQGSQNRTKSQKQTKGPFYILCILRDRSLLANFVHW